jgi:SulP family sulfate permease
MNATSGPQVDGRVHGRRARGWELGRPQRQDVIAGFVTGLFSIPEGMAYANIAGFNPVLGLYSGMLPTLVGSVFARTVLMATTLTSAIALSSQSVLQQAGIDPTDLRNIATLTLMVGVVMALFGILKVGSLMGFVSNAVMTGFTTGIALQIITGALKDATGYAPQSSNTVGKLLDSLTHVNEWQPAPTMIALITIGVWAVARRVKPLESLATLVALLVVSVGVGLTGVSVEKVGDIASIPRSFPALVLPDITLAPKLLTGAIAVSLVALAQAAGISAAVPNPDRSRPSASGDFLAQGIANLAGGFFQALPVGGSLSRTGVATSAGARTRWSGIFAGAWLALLVVLFGPLAESIPMSVIGGLVIVIGGEILWGRAADIRLVVRTATLPTVAMVVTFLATTALPLQDAILLGAGLSLILFGVSASRSGHLRGLERQGQEPPYEWRQVPVPDEAPSNSVTVLLYAGSGLFAEVARMDELWPQTSSTHHAVIVLVVQTLPDIPSTTFLKALARRSRQLRDQDVRLMLVGVDEFTLGVFRRSGQIDALGEDNIYPERDLLFGALNQAVVDAEEWIRGRSAQPAVEASPGHSDAPAANS